jgi:ribosomal protein L5
MGLSAITGTRASPLFAEKSDATRKIREGMPLGAHVTLTGGEMWVWLDRLKETVLPRVREWTGVDPLAVSNGAVTIILPDSVVGYFSDIEPHFDMV